MKKLMKLLMLVTLLVGVLYSCEKDDSGIPEGQGAVNVKLTDGPFPFDFVTSANIGIAKIELKNTSGEYTTVFEGSTSVNMVGLTNGDTETVVTDNLEAGTYNQVRITLNDASVHLSNGTDYDLSASAEGSYTVSISPAIVIEEGESSDLLIELDINDSFNFIGTWLGDWIPSVSNITGCDFDPDFRVCDLDQTGTIHGTVTVNGSPEANAYVTVTVDGNVLSTQTETDGSFTFIGVSEGTYTVTASTEANVSGSVNGVYVGGTGTDSVSCQIVIN